MKDMLDRLVHLQETDEKIVAHQRDEERIPLEIEERERGLSELESQRETVFSEMKDLEDQITELDHNLEESRNSIRRFQSRMLAVKTQREYQAVQREGDAARKKQGELESEIKELMEEKSLVEENLGDLDQSLKAAKEELEAIKRDLEGKLRVIKQEKEDLEKTREVEASLIDPQLLAKYQKVFNRYRGQGVVKVQGGVCFGCFMTIPPQLYNQVLAQGGVHQCPNCGRIIYVSET